MNNFTPPSFCADLLDRKSALRNDEIYLKKALSDKSSEFYLFIDDKPFLAKNNNKFAINTFSSTQIDIKKISQETPMFAGISNGCAQFLIKIKPQFESQICKHHIGEFVNLKSALWGGIIERLEIIGLGASIFGWQKNHQYCAKCGAKTILKDMGYKSFCNECKTEHFPRIDPVAIMLVLHDDKCLFGRSKEFPAGLYSVLAGFVEPCETIEQACRREVFEETGINIGEVKIIGNQPWPFVSQLMIGLEAHALDNKITINENEIDDAIWLDKDQARQLISKNGLEINGKMAFGPRPLAIAHSLVKYWIK